MKISLAWLADYLPGPTDAQTAADALMRGGLPVESIEKHGDDTVLDVEVTSNRSDCLSHVGVARELSALLKREFRDAKTVVAEATTPASSVTSVRIDAPQLCPHYTARVIRNVKIGPSPAWLVKRLEAIGVRAINNVVDVTNYVMFELGQPLHAFDFDKVGGRKIIVRNAKAGETLVSIDGHARKLSPEMLVIADEAKPVALAGVMGGLESEVSERTTNVLLECARFDSLSVRKTTRQLSMKSDSSYRYERGLDPSLVERASKRAAQLIVETAGGEVLSGIAEAGSGKTELKRVSLRIERMRKVLGAEISADEAVDALKRLGFAPQLEGGVINATVPSWRLDVGVEIDLIEEVARVVGYERIPVRETISITVTPPEAEKKSMDAIRSTLVGGGYFEAVTFTFATDLLVEDFLPTGSASLPRADAAVRKSDARLRPSILPGLLEAVRHNEANGTAGAKFFEAGSTFAVDGSGKIHEKRRLGLVGDTDLRGVRGAVEAVLRKLDATREVKVVPDHHAGYASGAAGRIEWGGKPVGHIGRIDRRVADKLSLRETPTAAELDLAPLIAGTQHVPQLRALPRYPAMQRDLSLVVSESTLYESLDSLIRKLDLPFLESIDYVTTYRGKPLDKGTKSLTTTLVFRSPSATLTSEQVEPSVQLVIDAARKDLNATLRA